MHDGLLVTGSQDASLKLWDLSKVGHTVDIGIDPSPLLQSFESHVDEITSLSFNSDTLVSGSADKTIRQWDVNTGHCMQTIDVLWASSMMNSHIGSIADFGSTSSWQPRAPVSSDYPFIGALQSFDAALASGTSDGMVRLWDLRSGEVIRKLVGHTGPVTCLQFDDRNLTSGSADRSVRIWDLRTGGILDSFAYDSPIKSLQFDSSRIVCTTNQNVVKVYDRVEERHWDLGGGVENPESTKTIGCARYEEGYLVEGGSDGSIGVWAI
ncbi:unnamed protein product [Ambrosiozyma monospora]|uniref:Unnamed protein product n=1 Tax=Ambrosiozyma monospora TaxID=43982 RepID=A0ACB5U8I3_AMBMO|nr:unnamed protein product [Ambrosiozyma monospora]